MLQHTKTEDMLADILTKSLTGKSFTRLRDRLIGDPNHKLEERVVSEVNPHRPMVSRVREMT